MEIIKDTKIREKWHRGFDREFPPDTIVIHGTGGGGTYQWVLTGGRHKEYVKGIALFHYLIERDGKTIEIIDPDRWVYHSSSGWFDKKTIGIELLNPSPTNSTIYSQAQYEALFDLIFTELRERYPITQILSHSSAKKKYSGSGKQCPGNFEWEKLENEMEFLNLTYSKKSEGYYIDIDKRHYLEES